MKVNIRVISQKTGFSPATVSNALNGKKGVSKETISKIVKTAEELGYEPSTSASKIKFVIYRKNGLIIDENPISASMIEGVEKKAKELGYETLICHLDYEGITFYQDVERILDDENSPIILLGTEMLEEDYKFFYKGKDRIIVLDGWCEESLFNSILIDNADSAYKSVNYLIKHGHRDIGYLQGDYRINAFQYRKDGYIKALLKNGITLDDKFIVTLGTRLESAYKDMMCYLEGKKELPTAFFSDNDIIAIGAIKALQERGIRVPEDISIIGFDDMNYSRVSTPKLTTVKVFQQEMGELAMARIDKINRVPKNIVEKVQICTKLIERDSVMQLQAQQMTGE